MSIVARAAQAARARERSGAACSGAAAPALQVVVKRVNHFYMRYEAAAVEITADPKGTQAAGSRHSNSRTL